MSLQSYKHPDIEQSGRFRLWAYSIGDIERQWKFLRPWLKRACDKSFHGSAAELRGYLMEDAYRLYGVREGDKTVGLVMCNIISNYSAKKPGQALNIALVTGHRLSEWLDDAIAYFKEIAREHECVMLTAWARTGAIKLLQSRGAKIFTTAMYLDLEGKSNG